MGDLIRNIKNRLGIFNYNNVSIIDNGWNVIIDNLNLKHLPKVDEFINVGNLVGGYYRVTNVIHVLTDKQRCFLVCEKVPDINNKSKDKTKEA